LGGSPKKKLSNKADPSQHKPNIVIVFADDLGIEALNAYGGHGIKTPHLDRLANDGLDLDQ
jgi:arylsulfatase A-like enzyme